MTSMINGGAGVAMGVAGGADASGAGPSGSLGMSHLKGYVLGKELGEGGFCKVRLGVHRLSGAKVAVKVVDKLRLSGPAEKKRMMREVRVMKKLCTNGSGGFGAGSGGGHPGGGGHHHAMMMGAGCIGDDEPISLQLGSGSVIRMFDVIDTASKVYIIMEYAPCGSLLDYVRGRKRVGEAEARKFLYQTLAGLKYCHVNNVIHRDMKLENLLLDDDLNIKIIDFGLSAIVVPGKRLRVHCGSPSYAAPEIVSRREYDGPPVDVWSLGVVLFAMTAGYLPFHARNNDKRELCNKIVKGVYKVPEGVMSAELQNLIRRMLTVDPSRRITLEGIAGHAWMVRKPMMITAATPLQYRNPVMEMDPAGAAHRYGKGTHVTYDNLQGIYSVAYNAQGEIEIDYDIVDVLVGHGFDADEVIDNVVGSECNYITTAYYLFQGKVRREIKRKRREQNNGGADAAEFPPRAGDEEPLDSGSRGLVNGGSGATSGSAGIVDRAGELTMTSNISSSINDSNFHEEPAANGKIHYGSNGAVEEDLYNYDAPAPKPMSFQRPSSSSSSRPSSASIRRRPSPALVQPRQPAEMKGLVQPLLMREGVGISVAT